MRFAARLSVNALMGGLVWCAASTAMALTDSGFSNAMVLAYSVGGALTGIVGGVAGSLICRYLHWHRIFGLPIGGAIATAIPLAIFGAVFGYSYPIAEGVGWESYLIQAFLAMLLFAVFGATAGAQLGFLAALPAHAVLWAFGNATGKH